jgi:hypothetical protein
MFVLEAAVVVVLPVVFVNPASIALSNISNMAKNGDLKLRFQLSYIPIPLTHVVGLCL